MGDNLEREYLEDKKYIHETLENTRKHTEKLHEKLDEFKLEVTKSLATIQTKLAMYVAGGSVVVGMIVNYVMSLIKVN